LWLSNHFRARYHHLKRQFQKYSIQVLILQRYVRGYFGRKKAAAFKQAHAENKASLVLQRVQRGRQSRLKTKIFAKEVKQRQAEETARIKQENQEREERLKRATELAQEKLEMESAVFIQRFWRGKSARLHLWKVLRAVLIIKGIIKK